MNELKFKNDKYEKGSLELNLASSEIHKNIQDII